MDAAVLGGNAVGVADGLRFGSDRNAAMPMHAIVGGEGYVGWLLVVDGIVYEQRLAPLGMVVDVEFYRFHGGYAEMSDWCLINGGVALWQV